VLPPPPRRAHSKPKPLQERIPEAISSGLSRARTYAHDRHGRAKEQKTQYSKPKSPRVSGRRKRDKLTGRRRDVSRRCRRSIPAKDKLVASRENDTVEQGQMPIRCLTATDTMGLTGLCLLIHLSQRSLTVKRGGALWAGGAAGEHCEPLRSRPTKRCGPTPRYSVSAAPRIGLRRRSTSWANSKGSNASKRSRNWRRALAAKFP